MKYKFLRISLLSVFAVLCGGVALGAFRAAAEADESVTDKPIVTLVHTAAVQGGSNAALKTLDTETHYYNNWGTTAWAAQAYAGFAWTLPSGDVVTSATLKFYSNCGGSNNTRSVEIYYKDGTGFDYENIELSAAVGTKIGTLTDHLAVEEKELDVTDAVKALISEGSSEIVFAFGGAAAGATLYGKGSATMAPQLIIETASASETTSYTVNFLDDQNNVLKDPIVHTAQAKGAKVTASAEEIAAFKSEDETKKYIYKGGNETITLVEDATANVINLIFREAEVWNYTVNAVSGETILKEIAKATAFEGDIFTQPIPRLLNIDGTIYTAGIAGNAQAAKSVTMDADNVVINVSMTATETQNVIYFSEAEDILTLGDGGNVPARCSFLAGGYAAEVTNIVTLTAGTYKIATASYANASTTFTFAAGEKTVFTVSGSGGWSDKVSEEFTLTEEATLTVQGGNASNALDYIYITSDDGAVVEVAGGDFGDASIEGEWEIALNDHYAGEWSLNEFTGKYAATLDGNTVTFEDLVDSYNIVAEFTAKNTLTFKKAIVGNPEALYPLTQNPYTDGSKVEDLGIDPENFVFESFTATYDPEAGTITFTPGSGLAFGNANKETGEFSYYMAAFDFVSASKAKEVIYGDASIEGEWNISINDHYVGASSRGEATDKYTATLEGNIVTFADEWGEAPIVAEFTAENTLTFKQTAVGEPATYVLTQFPFVYGPEGTVDEVNPEDFVFKSFTATYDPAKGTITFTPGSGLAYASVDASGMASYYTMAFDLVSAAKAGSKEEETYEVVGTYDMTIQQTYITGEKDAPTQDIKVEVRKNSDNQYWLAEVGTNNFEGMTIPFTYNEDTAFATFDPAYVGKVGSENYPVWVSAFVFNGTMTEPQPTYGVAFDIEKGFDWKDGAGFAWFVSESETEFSPIDSYAVFYVIPAAKEDDPTGINAVKVQFESGEVYNLKGQKVTKAQKGIFIINGKKVILK